MDTRFLEDQMDNLISNQSFEEFILPDYSGLNIKNLLPQIGAIFGVGSLNCTTLPGNCLAEMESIKKVMLIIFDGLGYNRLLSHMNNHTGTFAELAEKGVLKPITTVFPSTTSTALTSIFSGLSPAQHQIIGYHMFSKKYGLIYNTLDMKPVYGYSGRVELAKDYSHNVKVLMPILEQNGIKVSIITKASIINSGLSQITQKDFAPIPYLLSSDMWTNSAQKLEKPAPSLSITYYSGIDNLAHKYGPYSKEVAFELRSIEHDLEDFIKGLSKEVREETLLIIVADHGIAQINQSFYFKDAQELMQNLMLPPVGDGRATYLFCKPNEIVNFKKKFHMLVEGFKLFSTDELIQKGVFGPPVNLKELKEKLGDFTALGISDRLLEYPFFDADRQNPQLGAHGGMTAEEMIVPLLSVRLSEF